jgi:hypothetical protein
MSTTSSEGVTPLSSLLRTHVPLPLGSPPLQHLTSFEESLQVVRSPCCPRELPDAISESLSLDAGSPTPAVPPCALTCFFHDVIGLPLTLTGRLPRLSHESRLLAGMVFEAADCCRYFVMFRPPSLLAPQIVPTAAIPPRGSRGFYVRAYRALLPPHAPDMLTVRRQVIDGTGTCTLLDSQPCRLLQCHTIRPCHVSSPRHVERSGRFSRTTLSCLLRLKAYGTYHAGAAFRVGR